MDNNLFLFLLLPIIVITLVAWSLVWKGMALWKAAQRKELAWFIALLLINTVGILDILYLYVFSKESSAPSQTSGNSTPPTII